ncbi:TonB-dependent receptor [Sphingosinicella sp.]|uniref:TonB-dependent receptor n=1 Tax=Sphingosinicella sp. TaxID=1917971 RepID=UPI00179E8B63|nr:TonB-dependent receptor [Sphingosinicella sp.]MBA4759819.1 TonB-dependent receptor [Sphingosinicella sp.]MEA3539113.1 TonB-dependent receptor [Pseudomonadota bacterium]
MAMLISSGASAQSGAALEEVVVTAMRRDADNYDERIPAIGLRRIADYAVQQVYVAGDTREADQRRSEIYAMIKGAIELATGRGGIELATGEMVVEPLTLTNYRNLPLQNDGRPDSERTSFLIKTRLSGVDAKAALERIHNFIKSVPTVGRAELKPQGELTLSVVGPDQYRGQIIDLVAADARQTAAKLGQDYAVQAKGLDRPVEWSRASLTEVFLYVPYAYDVLPRPQ